MYMYMYILVHVHTGPFVSFGIQTGLFALVKTWIKSTTVISVI